MKRLTHIILLLIPFNFLWGQTRNTDNWFDFGSSHISKWIQEAPGKLGPNALPVPEMDYGRVGSRSSVTLGSHLNHMKGDTAINSYIDFYWAVAPERAAVKL